MTINICMYIYVGENAHWDIYAPPASGVARGGRGGQLPPGAARRGAPKSCQNFFKFIY